MSKLFAMTKRNCLVFLKDTGAVFFSLLSMIIVLVLMGVFLGEMNVEAVVDLLGEYGGVRNTALDRENATHLGQYWTLAGLVVVNSLTVTMMVIGTLVTDKVSDKLKSFQTAPVSRFLVAVSYIVAAVLIGFFFCVLTLTGYMVYICANGGAMLSVVAIIKVLGYTLVDVIIFAIIMYLVATLVKSNGAWGGIATVVGTLVGFLGAIYVPVGSLSEGIVNVLKCLPVLHGTSLMRKVMCEEILEETFAGLRPEVLSGYREAMGIDVLWDGKTVGNEFQLFFLGICGMIALVVIAAMAGKKGNGR